MIKAKLFYILFLMIFGKIKSAKGLSVCSRLSSCPCYYRNKTLKFVCKSNIRRGSFVFTKSTALLLPIVENIIIEGNLESFPLKLCNYVNIKFVKMSNNKLKDLAEFVSGSQCSLVNLQAIDFSHNKLSRINQDAFKSFTNLTQLNLAYNKIEEIDSNAFKYLPMLKHVNLARNNLNTIPKYLFQKHLSNLISINLSNNFLTEMELWPFYLPNIRTIDFKYNLIKNFTNKFEWNFLHEANELMMRRNFDLSFNKIEIFDDETIQQYGVCSDENFIKFFENYLSLFSLNNNSIICDCNRQQRLISLLKRKKTVAWDLKCSSPEKYVNKFLNQIEDNLNFSENSNNKRECDQDIISSTITINDRSQRLNKKADRIIMIIKISVGATIVVIVVAFIIKSVYFVKKLELFIKLINF